MTFCLKLLLLFKQYEKNGLEIKIIPMYYELSNAQTG